MLKYLLFLIGSLATVQAPAQVDLGHQEFVFSLPADWKQVASDDPERWTFESKEKRTSVVLSIVPKLNIPPSGLVNVAKKFAAIRKEVEQKSHPGQKIVYGDEWVELKPSGDVVEIAYAAYDETGTIFRFFGYVTQAKILSFWVATEGRDNDLSKRAFDEAFSGLKFYVP